MLYTLIFIQEGYIQEGQPQFGQKIKKFIYMMTSLLLNKGLRLNSDSNLLIYKKECMCHKMLKLKTEDLTEVIRNLGKKRSVAFSPNQMTLGGF